MNLSLHINPESMHHAYGIVGRSEETASKLDTFFSEKLKIKVRGNPDVWIRSYETFGIDEGRAVKDFSLIKSATGKKIIVISFKSITSEAQNSLLKVLEEPVSSVHLFLVFPSLDILLPTLVSRLFVIPGEQNTSDGVNIKEFLSNSMDKRMGSLSKIIEGKNKSEAIDFLNQLEEYFHEKTDFSKVETDEIFVLKEIMKSRDYLKDRSPSVKLILEHIAGIVPSV